jgi:hypothetical protein
MTVQEAGRQEKTARLMERSSMRQSAIKGGQRVKELIEKEEARGMPPER